MTSAMDPIIEPVDPDFVLERVDLSDSDSDSFEYRPLPLPTEDSDLADSSSESSSESSGPSLRPPRHPVSQGGRTGVVPLESPSSGESLGVLLRRAERRREKRETEFSAPVRPVGQLMRRPESSEDWVRNFLVRMRMDRALEAFQEEWYERGMGEKMGGDVPDVYVQNQVLVEQVLDLERELARAKDVASKARQTWSKFRKERDFHMLHHKRVAQEKSKLLTDLQRLKKHYATYQPLIEETRNKYEKAMKDRALMKLKVEQLEAKISTLTTTVRQLEASKIPGQDSGNNNTNNGSGYSTNGNNNSKNINNTGKRNQGQAKNANASRGGKAGASKKKQEPLHISAKRNPHLESRPPVAPVERFGLMKTIRAHDLACSDVRLHPSRPIAATVSDDSTWKLFNLPDGELIMTGEGHLDWVGGCAFSTPGSHLATCSGDGSVKIWDLAKSSCVQTMSDHAQAVWSVDYITGEDLVVSSSMDHTARLFDVETGRCRQTFRGHVDSVNKVVSVPYTHYILTASGDKTVSLWDARSGLCVQTFYGHSNACNGVAVSPDGATIASSDADGVVKIWDTRAAAETREIIAGPHPGNDLAIDSSGEVVALCSDSGVVKLYNVGSGETLGALSGHEDACQSAAFAHDGKFMVTCGSDGSIRYWSG